MLNTKPGWVQIMFWVKNGRRHQVFIDSFISYVASPLQERMQRVTVSRTTVKIYMEWSSVVKIRQNIGVPTGMCIYLLGDAEIVKVFLCLILICCGISFKLFGNAAATAQRRKLIRREEMVIDFKKGAVCPYPQSSLKIRRLICLVPTSIWAPLLTINWILMQALSQFIKRGHQRIYFYRDYLSSMLAEKWWHCLLLNLCFPFL